MMPGVPGPGPGPGQRRYASYGSLLLGVTGLASGASPKTPKSQGAVTQETTLECPDARKAIISIAKFPAFVQFGYYPRRAGGSGIAAGQGQIVWQAPQFFPPMLAAVQRDFDAVRAWAGEAANEPEIVISPA